MNREDFYKALYQIRKLPDTPPMKHIYTDDSPLTFAFDKSYESYADLQGELYHHIEQDKFV